MKGGIFTRLSKLLAIILTILATVNTSLALPEMLDSFNAMYNTTGTRLDSCDLCHVKGELQRSSCDEVCHITNKPQKIDPINLNAYGKSLKDNENLPTDKALVAIEKIDSAGDRIPNIVKIRNLKFPGEKGNSTDKNENVTTPPANKNNWPSVLDLLKSIINKTESSLIILIQFSGNK